MDVNEKGNIVCRRRHKNSRNKKNLCTISSLSKQTFRDSSRGNVAFGEYERDEEECDLTVEAIARGDGCESAALLIPLSDVLLHPEYKHFGVVDSIAILKLLTPVKSRE